MNRLTTIVLAGGLAATFVFGTSVQANSGPTLKKPVAPKTKEAFRLILANGKISINGASSCDSVKSPGDNSLADYMSTVLANQADPTIGWHIEVTPKALPGVRNRWQVDVKFFGKDQSETYDMGVRFVIDDLTRKMERTSIMCIGTS